MKAPTAFVCSRQGLKVLKNERAFGTVAAGAYLLKKRDNANITIMASGSELMLALQTACELEKEGIIANVVSVPCYDLFVEQEQSYIDQVIDKNTRVYAVEAARGLEYYKFADVVFGMDTFGASGPANDLFEEFGFTIPKLKAKIVADLKK